MEEQFILRVPSAVAELIDRLLSENASCSQDGAVDLSFREDGRSGTFVIGNDSFPASLLDLPCIVESYKTYDDNVLIKTADIGQIVMVQEEKDVALEDVDYKHGLTPPMRDARRRRFRREPDLNPELVRQVEKDLLNIMAGGTVDQEMNEQDDGGNAGTCGAQKSSGKPVKNSKAPEGMNAANPGEPDKSETDDSDDSL